MRIVTPVNQFDVGKIASIDRGWLPRALSGRQVRCQLVGKIASIDRGWLPGTVTPTSTSTSTVGKIASIDRGWLRRNHPLRVAKPEVVGGKNSLD